MNAVSNQETPLPASIKVGWKRYRVEDWPETDSRDEGRMGEANHIKRRIRVSAGLGDGQRAETLLHEILHVTMRMWSIEIVQLSRQQDPEEALVTALASGLSTVMRDNPEMMAYLSRVWAGQASQ